MNTPFRLNRCADAICEVGRLIQGECHMAKRSRSDKAFQAGSYAIYDNPAQ